MKTPVLLLSAALLAPVLSPGLAAENQPGAGGPVAATVVAEVLVDALVAEDFVAASAHFDARMRYALPAAKLETVWHNLIRQVGPFRQRLGVRTEKQPSAEAVFVLCEFRDFILEAKVVFNQSGEVCGLFFAPPPRDS